MISILMFFDSIEWANEVFPSRHFLVSLSSIWFIHFGTMLSSQLITPPVTAIESPARKAAPMPSTARSTDNPD
jgi:hypothetical protein